MSAGQDIGGRGTRRIIIDSTGAGDDDVLTYDAPSKSFKPAAAASGSSFEADAELGGAEAARATVAAGVALRGDAGSDYVLVSDTGVLVVSGTADITISAGDVLLLTGTASYGITGVEGQVSATGNLQVDGTPLELKSDGTTRIEVNATGIGFFGATPAAKPTGVAVDAAGIHAALVTLGLIAGA